MKHALQGQRVLVTGGTGFIGRALCKRLNASGCQVLVATRSPSSTVVPGVHPIGYSELAQLKSIDAVVNLAGENIAGGRWTARRRETLRRSRIETTQRLCAWLNKLDQPPSVVLSASAIGYYGETGERSVAEDAPPGSDFAAQLCADWEAALTVPQSTRLVILRIGVVLGAGGALERMLPAFRLGLGGRLGSGRQWMSWIALADLLGLIERSLTDRSMQGVYNAVAPQAARNAEFSSTLGHVLRRPAVLPAPAWILRLLLGDMSQLLLGSQRVISTRVQALQYPALEDALRAAIATDESG